VAEVARIVGKRPGTVRVLAHRGLRRLARRAHLSNQTMTELIRRLERDGPTPATPGRR
jgi:DNA-directed RNA polymerase specialized sigma24 family protein